ncbi:MAG: hypothetical protein K5840_02325, partial [Eubacterium sp.]|nr:hypothetical protein [Eubacterium sp.]
PLAFSWALVMFLIQSHICMGASLALFAVGYAVLYMSFGFAMSPGETGALATLPKELNADGVSIINTFIQVAAGLSAAFFTGIMSTATSASVASGAGESVAMAYGYRAALLAGAACSLVAVICGFLAGLKKEEIH